MAASMEEYVYTSITGNKYVPVFRNGKWYIGAAEVAFLQLAALLKIDTEEELTFFKLKYGADLTSE